MSLKLFLAIAATTYGAMFACSDSPPDPPAPATTTTITTSTSSTSTSSTSTSSTTTAAPTPIVFPDTPCQEWAPTAVEAGWPADPLVLDKLHVDELDDDGGADADRVP